MTVAVTAFDRVPDFAQGRVRDPRVRRELERVGAAHDVRYRKQGEHKRMPRRALADLRAGPTGQPPTDWPK